ncbi:MAG: type I polyketide synthase [Pyrinomonadaceae bacterium]
MKRSVTDESPLDGARTPEPVAIIGMACRFPQADSPAAFWRLLRGGVDAVTEVPPDRWDADAFYDEDANAPGKMTTRWGGFLEQVDGFDAHFFKVSPREAPHLDPQQRLLMQVTWEALEDAGQVPARLAGTPTGVFVGIMGNDYGDTPMNDPALVNFYTFPGIARCIAANRLSYFFDFRGPSMAVDTACSSSLVATHLACRSLRDGESSLAVAGGVNLMLSPEGTIWYAKAGLLARDGRCKTFDARADGLARGEGCGVVVLKLLSRALADGDPVHAIIRGGAVNQDGRSNGLTAPNRWSQEALVRAACREAGVSPAQLGYVEAHGTGTALGDPIEAKALGAVLAEGRAEGDACSVGSVKTNIGHLEAAAGIAGLLKVVLMLKHGELAPSLHFEQPNPHIPFERLPLSVQRTPAPWPAGRRLAGVSSFGFGGTNAHLVVGEAPQAAPQTSAGKDADEAAPRAEQEPAALLLPLSARTHESLRAQARAYRQFLQDEGAAVHLRDICYTAAVRRTHHEHRLAAVGRSREEIAGRLSDFLDRAEHPSVSTGQSATGGRRAKLAFVFAGQGPQWWGMGRQLLRDEPVFRRAVEECDAAFAREAGWSLLGELQAEQSASRVAETEVAQPCLFALQLGLAALWRSWGVEPEAAVGHSVGEVAAACFAGALTLADAARVVYHRSRLQQRATGKGRMAAVALDPPEVAEALAGYAERLALAAHNGPRACVISGDGEALDEVLEALRGRGVECQPLRVNYAFHSPQMRDLAAELVGALADIKPGGARLSVYSTLNGRAADGVTFGADYWGVQLQQPVLFAPAVEALRDGGHDLFLELSPHPVLTASVVKSAPREGREAVALPSLRRSEDERTALLRSLGGLFAQGLVPAWERVQEQGARCVALPAYQWQLERYWLKEQRTRNARLGRPDIAVEAAAGHTLLGRPLESAAQPDTYIWETAIDAGSLPYLAEHRVRGAVWLPAAFPLRMALDAAAQLFAGEEVELTQARFEQGVELGEGEARRLQLVVSNEPGGAFAFRLFGRRDDDPPRTPWTLHVRGMLAARGDAGHTAPVSTEEVFARCGEVVPGEEFYRSMSRRGLEYGPSFRGVHQVWRRDGEAIARVSLDAAPDRAADDAPPPLIDACLQLIAAALPRDVFESSDETYLPVQVESVRAPRHESHAAVTWGYALFTRDGDAAPDAPTFTADAYLLDEAGGVRLELRGVRLRRALLTRPADEDKLREDKLLGRLYEVVWRRRETTSEPTEEQRRERARGRWLIFADAGGVADAAAARLSACGADCVLVRRGEMYRRTDDAEFQINPAHAEQFERLLAEVAPEPPPLGAGASPALRGVLHFWAADAPRPATAESLTQAQEDGCRSVLHLVQSLARRGLADGARLWLVTQGAQAVGAAEGTPEAAERVDAAQSLVWGLGRVIARELPPLRCTLIDLGHEGIASKAEALCRELLSASDERQVAWRGENASVPRLRRATRAGRAALDGGRSSHHVERDAPARTGPIPLRADGTTPLRADGAYLITGGTRGLGLSVARWMVGRGARHLMLVGRGGATPEAREAVAEMERSGAHVSVAVCDVSDRGALARLLEDLKATLPPLKGVVHAAGVVDDALVGSLDWPRFARTLAPKAQGAWNLHGLTLDAALDFFVLFSSVSSLLGNQGQAAYAAGNAFLDALAHERRALGLPAVSINWGPWAEFGMAAALRDDFARRGVRNLQPDEGLEAFGRLLAAESPQVGVWDVSWPKFAAANSALAGDAFLDELLAAESARADSADAGLSAAARVAAATTPLAVRLQAASPGEGLRLLVSHVQETARRVMGLPETSPPDVSQGFFDLGMDSLMIAELGRSLAESVGREFPLSAVFEHPTAEALSRYVAEHVLSLQPHAAPPRRAPPERAEVGATIDKLEQLSDEEALALLAELLPPE